MNIELKKIPVKDVFKGYLDNNEDGVIGFNGKLNIRPKYQREFIYKDKQREAVLNTIKKGFPLNTIYWAKNNDETYELLDGQQRTISICSYINGEYSINYQYFHNLTQGEKDQILNYELMVYICEGSDREKLEWFKVINIAGEKLTDQELRNAVYTGEWLTDAKNHFSKNNCVAYSLAKNYMTGSPIRQDYLETAILWITNRDGIEIEDYMALFQNEKDASELWIYFQNVINWVNIHFPKYRKEMKGIKWGYYYNKYYTENYNPNSLEEEFLKLIVDEDITSIRGIYEYLIDGEEKHLSLRAFSVKMKMEAYTKQDGLCKKCSEPFDIEDMEGDHITPWSQGGKTIASNCQMLCKHCNRIKSDI